MSADLPRYAVASVGHQLDARFLLDHDAHTAIQESIFPHEAAGGSITSGVHAEVDAHTLRLMGSPFNTHVAYQLLCEDCNADDATNLWATSQDELFWLRWKVAPYRHLCDACWRDRDNAEPPEPDGEAFRGGEAAAFQREQMAAAQRLK